MYIYPWPTFIVNERTKRTNSRLFHHGALGPACLCGGGGLVYRDSVVAYLEEGILTSRTLEFRTAEVFYGICA